MYVLIHEENGEDVYYGPFAACRDAMEFADDRSWEEYLVEALLDPKDPGRE